MPANAVMNILYPMVALFWFFRLRRWHGPRHDFYLWSLFTLMVGVYGPIQFFRIVNDRDARWALAIADGWMTPVFFSIPVAWGTVALQRHYHILLKWKTAISLAIIGASTCSYLFSCYAMGFEIALFFHIVAGVYVGFKLCDIVKWNRRVTLQLFLALVSCTAFVFLKIYDHQVPLLHVGYGSLSGHFYSKFGDVGQMHFSLAFAYEYLHANPDHNPQLKHRGGGGGGAGGSAGAAVAGSGGARAHDEKSAVGKEKAQ